MGTSYKVCVVGCCGKMGQTISRALLSHDEFKLKAAVDIVRVGDDIGSVLNIGQTGIIISSNLQKSLLENKIDFVIDFTNATAVVNNIAISLQAKVPALVGTTGMSDEDLEKLKNLASKMQTPLLIVPNFAIGAILLMEFCQKAAKYFKDAEIIEMHHPQKLDKPSGTSKRTRDIILEAMNRAEDKQNSDLIPIHSVRLPGLVAHQEVIFGGIGQILTIRHDSLSRESFLPGIFLALNQLKSQKQYFKLGLEL